MANSRNRFILQATDKTKCSTCGNTVDLLCLQDLLKQGPMFYICWGCRTVAQVGVGLVKRDEDI